MASIVLPLLLPLPAARPLGTVVFFHGCARLSNSFFPYNQAACPECIGLPEELALTKQVRAEEFHMAGWTFECMHVDLRVVCTRH